MLGHFKGIFTNAVHAQRQCFYALQNLECIHGTQRCAHVSQWNNSGTANVRGFAQCLGIDNAVVTDIGLIEALETFFVLGPGEFSRVDDDAANGGAVAAQIFGQRVHHNVCAVLKGTAQIGTRYRVVDDQWYAVFVCNCRQRRQIGDIAKWVANGLAIHRLGAGVDQFGKGGGITVVGKSHLNAHLREGVGKQVVGAAVKCRG